MQNVQVFHFKVVVKKEDEHGMQRIKQRKFGSAAHIQKL